MPALFSQKDGKCIFPKLFPGEEALLFFLLPRVSEFALSLKGALAGDNATGAGATRQAPLLKLRLT